MHPTLVLAAAAAFLTSTAQAAKPVTSAWFADWANTDLNTVNWAQYTEMDYFVAITQPLPNAIQFTASDENYAKQFASTARKNGVKPSLTLGGWTGSAFFSSLVATADSRTQFANLISQKLGDWGFDGVSLDWEYPGREGQEGNQVSPDDTANFLKFLKILREKLGTSKTISAAVSITGFTGPDGQPIADASEFARYFDWIAIMAYDVAGAWNEQTGNLAPLSAACAPPQQALSVETAYDYWTGAGFPANKLVLGIPAYGYEFELKSTTLKTTTSPDGKVSKAFQDKTGFTASHNYDDLVNDGILTRNGNGKNGWVTYWDSCSSAPFAINTSTKRFLTYDNPKSIQVKTKWAKDHSMKGVKMFSWQGDLQDGLLIKSAKAGFVPLLTRGSKPKLTRPHKLSKLRT